MADVTPREIAALLRTAGFAFIRLGMDDAATGIRDLADEVEAGKWVRVPECGVRDGDYGRCQLPAGHDGVHREMRDGKVWAEWSGPPSGPFGLLHGELVPLEPIPGGQGHGEWLPGVWRFPRPSGALPKEEG